MRDQKYWHWYKENGSDEADRLYRRLRTPVNQFLILLGFGIASHDLCEVALAHARGEGAHRQARVAETQNGIDQEQKKQLLIPISNAGPNPRTMVVHFDYAFITYRTVMRPRRLGLLADIAHSKSYEASQITRIITMPKLKRQRSINSLLSFTYIWIVHGSEQTFSESITIFIIYLTHSYGILLIEISCINEVIFYIVDSISDCIIQWHHILFNQILLCQHFKHVINRILRSNFSFINLILLK